MVCGVWCLWCVKDDTESGSKQKYQPRDKRYGQAMAVTLSSDGQFLAVGCEDKIIRLFDTRALDSGPIDSFKGHRKPVTVMPSQLMTVYRMQLC